MLCSLAVGCILGGCAGGFWSAVSGSPHMDIRTWVYIYEYACMDTRRWISMYGNPYMDIYISIYIYGYATACVGGSGLCALGPVLE